MFCDWDAFQFVLVLQMQHLRVSDSHCILAIVVAAVATAAAPVAIVPLLSCLSLFLLVFGFGFCSSQ